MNGLEKITDRILGDAQAEADRILAEAKAERERILADYAARRRMPNDEIKKYIQCF